LPFHLGSARSRQLVGIWSAGTRRVLTATTVASVTENGVQFGLTLTTGRIAASSLGVYLA